MNNREAMQEEFESWWNGRQLPENMKAVFFMVWQAALASQQPEITTKDIDAEFLKECADENGHCVLKNDVTFALGYKSGYQACLARANVNNQSQAQQPKAFIEGLQALLRVNPRYDAVVAYVDAFKPASQAQQPTDKFLADAKNHMLTALQKKLSTGDFDSADIQVACRNIESYLKESQAQKDHIGDSNEMAQSQAQKPAFPPRDLTKPAEQQGMFSKFHVERVDGSSAKGGKHHGCRYWVLDLDHDKHAPAAMRGYAEDCKETHPVLSAEIFAEFGMQSQVQQTERQWLPMETAPKDKTKILIKFIKHEAASSEVVDAWFEDGWRRIDYGRNTYVYLVGCELLGWMPLPPAPEGDKS